MVPINNDLLNFDDQGGARALTREKIAPRWHERCLLPTKAESREARRLSQPVEVIPIACAYVMRELAR